MKLFQPIAGPVFTNLLFLCIFFSISCSQQQSRDKITDLDDKGKETSSGREKGKVHPDTIRVINRTWSEVICSKEQRKFRRALIPFETDVAADSVSWELAGISAGIMIDPQRGSGATCTTTIIRENSNSTGEIILRVTPFKSGFTPQPAEVRILVEKCANPCDAMRGRNRRELPSFNDSGYCSSVSEILDSGSSFTDSTGWQYKGCSAGVRVILQGGHSRGSRVIPPFRVAREPGINSGTVTFRITRFTKGCSQPGPADFIFWFGQGAGCRGDTSLVNRKRRESIMEFRELLYMCSRTNSATEREYFKTVALGKLEENPSLNIDILPGTGIHSLFEDREWSAPLVLPVYDGQRCYIVGMKIRQK